MNPVTRLARELTDLKRVASPDTFLRYLTSLARNGLAVIKARSLVAADAGMRGDVDFVINGERIVVPLDAIWHSLSERDETPTFGSLREMYAQNVYLRAFRPATSLGAVLDLGGNRGLFSILAVKAYGASIAVSVEPLAQYNAALSLLREANGLEEARTPRVNAFASDVAGEGKVTLPQLLARHDIVQVGFMKCDIEGGEFALLSFAGEALRRIDNIAIEMHPEMGDPSSVVAALSSAGFALRPTDQFGDPPQGAPHYLYASRTDALLEPGRPVVRRSTEGAMWHRNDIRSDLIRTAARAARSFRVGSVDD